MLARLTGAQIVLALVASLLLTGAVRGEPVRYDDHAYVLVTATTPEQVRALDAIGINLACQAGPGVQAMVVHRDRLGAIDELGLPRVTIANNVQTLVDAEQRSMDLARAQRDAAFFTTYRRYAEISDFIDDTVLIDPAIASRFFVGSSLENRDIFGIRITGPGDATGRPIFVIQGCQHAREWISPMSCCWTIERLVNDYGVDPEITALVDAVDFRIIPLVNPDGYEYSHTSERFWRKNRRNNGDGTTGVDLNRNWDYQWGGPGSSGFTSDETYRGPSPFSEPETTVVSDYIESIAGTPTCIGDCSGGNKCSAVKAHLDVHSYGALILGPWGYTDSVAPPREAELRDVQEEMEAAMTSAEGVGFTAGLGVDDLLYIADGIAPDWGFGVLGALAWTFELRPAGSLGLAGFDLPVSEIDEGVAEAFAGIKVLAHRLAEPVLDLTIENEPLALSATAPTTITGQAFSTPVCVDAITDVLLHSRPVGGSTYTSTPMVGVGDLYTADLPALPCGDGLEYYLEAISVSGAGAFAPVDGPVAPNTLTSLEQSLAFDDTFESDLGWTVEDSVPLGDGTWDRGIPVGGGDRGDPPTDFDGSGSCFLTDNVDDNSDVDEGTTTLISPVLDASDATSVISYARWFDNSFGAVPGTKPFDVEVSDDGGANWVNLETVGPAGPEVSGGWYARSFSIADIPGITNTSQFRIRFAAIDFAPGSVVEAAVDAVRITTLGCAPTPDCAGDVDGDNDTDVFDFGELAANFGAGPGATLGMGDLNGDGFVNVFDFSDLAADFGCAGD